MKNIKKIFFIFLFILFVNKVFSQDNLHNFLEKLHSGNYVIDFYCDVLKSENRDTIHKYSDIYVDREFPDPDYFVVKYKWYDMQIFPMEKIYIRIDKSNNKIDEEYFEILDHGIHPRSFTIKQNIEICFEEDINNYLFDDKSTYDWAIVRKNNVNTFYFNFDGDYLNVYLNGETDKDLFATFVNMNDETLFQFKNLIENNTCDLSRVTWPRHADGTCDYEDVSTVKTVPSPTTNVTSNKTMTVSENLKLRSGEATSTQVLTVMSTGTRVKITGTNTYIDVELDGRTARIAGEMIVGGFVCYKSSMKNWLVPENEPLTEDDKKEIIQKVTEKTAGSHMVITFE